MHPHSDACVQTVLPRSCIYVSPGILRGPTGCTMRCFGAWEQAMHHARRSSSSSLRGKCTQTTIPVCNLCQAGCASACPLANRVSEQTAPCDALLFGSWQCIIYADKCNIKQFALSGLVHPHSDVCVQTVLPRSCIYIYVSPGLL